MLTLTTLGSVGLIQADGQPVTRLLGQPKNLAVLVYLAHHERRSVFRDELRGLFWADTPDSLSRRALNQALYRLRAALGPRVIQSLGDLELRVNRDYLRCDSCLFELAFERRSFTEALELYRGEFLPGFSVSRVSDFERWVESTRSRLRFQAVRAGSELFAFARREGRVSEARQWARRRLELAPTDEGALRDLLTVLVEGGDRAEALETYREFARDLARDLEVAPSSQTQALIRMILAEHRAVGSPQSGTIASTVTADREMVETIVSPVRVSARRRLSVAITACLVAALGMGSLAHQYFARRVDQRAKDVLTAAHLTRIGRFFWSQRSDESLRSAIRFFTQATAADVGYAPAYSGLADAYTLDVWYGDSASRTKEETARQAAMTAVLLDDQLAQAHTSLGGVKAWFDNDWRGAEAEYRRAISLDSGYATAHHWFALGLAVHNRLDEATREMRTAQRHDPLSPSIATDLAMLLFWSGRDQEAIEQIRYALTLDPGSSRASSQLWRIYTAAGQPAEAIVALGNLISARRGSPAVIQRLRGVYARRGLRGAMEWWAGILERSPSTSDRAIRIAVLYVLLHRNAEALRWLRQARDERSPFLRFAMVDPAFRDLRADRQFVHILSSR